MNALTPELMDALASALEGIQAARSARAIVIAGDERSFAAGSDLKSMRDRSFETVLTQASNNFWPRIRAIELPLVAAVSGYAFGAGCELALSCDIIVASETALFSQAEILVGIIPGGGGTQWLARTIGKQRTMEMVLTGSKITAQQGYDFGFVNRVTASNEWIDVAIELAGQIASKPPLAVLLGKRAVLAAEEAPLTLALSHERRLYELTMATEDRVEGMSAFIEKRDPVWRGR